MTGNGTIYIECDHCGFQKNMEDTWHSRALSKAKRAGWRVRSKMARDSSRDDPDLCPTCAAANPAPASAP